MQTSHSFRKVFQGVATRYEMFQIFNRHSEAPFDKPRHSGSIYAGEWFEIREADHDYMFEILPPLFVRGDLFAMREFQAGNVTSVFLALTIDGSLPLVPRLLRSVRQELSRASPRSDHRTRIPSCPGDDARGAAWSISGAAPMATIAAMPVSGLRASKRGQRTVLFCGGRQAMTLKLLDELSDDEIAAKLPVQLRFLPELIAA